jgi:hypothetical protein
MADNYRSFPLGQVVEFGLRDQLLPKGLFIEDSKWVGEDYVGGELGRALARGEVDHLIKAVAMAPLLDVSPIAGFPEQLREAVDSFRQRGYRPRVLLLPVEWRLQRVLGLLDPWREATPPSEWNIPPDASHWYLGELEETAVFQWPSLPRDTAYLLDPGTFGKLMQGSVDETGELLLVEVTPFDEREAAALAEQEPTLLRAEGAGDSAARSLRIREHVRVRVRERLTLEISDPAAAGRIRIPKELIEGD